MCLQSQGWGRPTSYFNSDYFSTFGSITAPTGPKPVLRCFDQVWLMWAQTVRLASHSSFTWTSPFRNNFSIAHSWQQHEASMCFWSRSLQRRHYLSFFPCCLIENTGMLSVPAFHQVLSSLGLKNTAGYVSLQGHFHLLPAYSALLLYVNFLS